MSDTYIILSELRAIRELVSNISDRHLGRRELAARWGISPATLDRRVKAGIAPRPVHGKWPLSTTLRFEAKQMHGEEA